MTQCLVFNVPSSVRVLVLECVQYLHEVGHNTLFIFNVLGSVKVLECFSVSMKYYTIPCF